MNLNINLIDKIVSGGYEIDHSFLQLCCLNLYLKVNGLEVLIVASMRSQKVQMFVKIYDTNQPIEYNDVLGDLDQADLPLFDYEFVQIKITEEQQEKLFNHFKKIHKGV